MNRPRFATALPKRRYQIGDFSAVVLGDVESSDEVAYRYIFALVQDGKDEPSLYVLSIRQPSPEGEYLLKVVAPNMERDLNTSDAWRDLDHFCEQAISLAQQVMGLKDEAAHRLM